VRILGGYWSERGKTLGAATHQAIGFAGMNGWDALGIADPVEWVRAVHQQDLSRLDAYWHGTEEASEEDSL
jgi:hypothetical protein